MRNRTPYQWFWRPSRVQHNLRLPIYEFLLLKYETTLGGYPRKPHRMVIVYFGLSPRVILPFRTMANRGLCRTISEVPTLFQRRLWFFLLWLTESNGHLSVAHRREPHTIKYIISYYFIFVKYYFTLRFYVSTL